jgi:hypothetical protein
MKQILLATIFAAGATAGIYSRPSPTAAPPPTQAQSATPNDYGDEKTWLCRPGRHDGCDVDLTATAIAPDGSLMNETWQANSNAPIDCFYVYPTVSAQPTANADMTLDPAESAVVRSQFARYGSQCKLYAPLYRQVTLAGLRGAMAGGGHATFDRGTPYDDVLAAWKYYLAHDNRGRGVVLVGHSQGSSVLLNLIANEIDGTPVQKQLVSAILMGTTIAVPRGKAVGGTFTHIPLCHSTSDTGCVVTFASFRATAPPPENTLFGHVSSPGMVAACTNPAALSGGPGLLHSYFSGVTSRAWLMNTKPISTPWVSLPGLFIAECQTTDSASYLAISVRDGDTRDRTIPGDTIVAGQVQGNWGLHTADTNFTLGNMVELVSAEAKAYGGPAKR